MRTCLQVRGILMVVSGLLLTIQVVGPANAAEISCPTANPNDLECAGVLATCVGTNDDDVITGTDGDDVIVARRGDDVVDARGGNDIVCGNRGQDVI